MFGAQLKAGGIVARFGPLDEIDEVDIAMGAGLRLEVGYLLLIRPPPAVAVAGVEYGPPVAGGEDFVVAFVVHVYSVPLFQSLASSGAKFSINLRSPLRALDPQSAVGSEVIHQSGPASEPRAPTDPRAAIVPKSQRHAMSRRNHSSVVVARVPPHEPIAVVDHYCSVPLFQSFGKRFTVESLQS